MTDARRKAVDALWHGRDPFGTGPGPTKPDHQGWNFTHHYLSRAIDEALPGLVVEIGVWKGGSVLTMAQRIKERGLDAVVIAVDTWLGSSEHWLDRNFHFGMERVNGYPQIYSTFVANVFDRALENYILPLPLDSINACEVLNALSMKPDVIHIDAGHDFRSVMSDLEMCWSMLKAGGVLVGDDYYTDAPDAPGVRDAFNQFFQHNEVALFESGDGKCFVRKPN